MDVRAMGDDSVVVIAEEDDEAKSAWPAWKHLLEDLAEAQPPPPSAKLAYKNLGDAGAFRLGELLRSQLRGLTLLDLSCTSIGSSGAAALAASLQSHGALRALDMGSNAVTDSGATAFAGALSSNQTLESICLHACLVGDKGATALAGALQGNGTLTELNLRQNYIDDAGASALAQAIARQGSALRVLDVQSNSYKRAGRRALADAYHTNPAVEKSMPLAWRLGGTGGRGQGDSKEDSLRTPITSAPRSLPSVDSAAKARKKSVPGSIALPQLDNIGSFGGGVHRQGSAAPEHAAASPGGSSPINSPTPRVVAGTPKAVCTPKLGTTRHGGSWPVYSASAPEYAGLRDDDDNGKPRSRTGLHVRDRLSVVFSWCSGRHRMFSWGGASIKSLAGAGNASGTPMSRISRLRLIMAAAIVLAAGSLYMNHLKLEALEKKGAPNAAGVGAQMLFNQRKFKTKHVDPNKSEGLPKRLDAA